MGVFSWVFTLFESGRSKERLTDWIWELSSVLTAAGMIDVDYQKRQIIFSHEKAQNAQKNFLCFGAFVATDCCQTKDKRTTYIS